MYLFRVEFISRTYPYTCDVPTGVGKTHYIKEQLKNSPAHVTIAVTESFTPLKSILRLRNLPLDKHGVAIFFNFTMLPPGVCVCVTVFIVTVWSSRFRPLPIYTSCTHLFVKTRSLLCYVKQHGIKKLLSGILLQ